LKKGKVLLRETSEGIVLENGIIKLSLKRMNNSYTQEYFARVSNGWKLICSAERDNPSLEKSSKTCDVVISQGMGFPCFPRLT